MPHESPIAQTIEWYTPPWLLQQLGEFDLDPCSPLNNPFSQRIGKNNYTIKDDGLNKKWKGRVFLNPPYGREIKYWMKKISEHNNGIALVFARVDTEWFHNYVFNKASSLFFFKGRIKFYKPDGTESSTNGGAPSVLIAYGKENIKTLKNLKIEGELIILDKNIKKV